jgi:hypothetical protein
MNRKGMSKVIAVIAAIVIVVGTASAYFFVLQPGAPAQQQVSPAAAPQPEQAAPALPPEQQVQQAVQPPPVQLPAGVIDTAKADALKTTVDGHFNKFATKDVPGLMADYTQTGTYTEWKGQAGAFAGRYDGFPRVRILYATIAGNIESIKGIRIENYKADIAGDTATVAMKVVGAGRGKLIGAFDMEVEATQKWVYHGGNWFLQDDRWDFKVFKTEIVAEGTVFPINWRKIGDFSGWNDRIKSLFGN